MNLKPVAVLFCLSTLYVCNANKFLPSGNWYYRGPSSRQFPEYCDTCEPPTAAKLQPVIDLLKEIGQIQPSEERDFMNDRLVTKEDLQSAVDMHLAVVKEKIIDINPTGTPETIEPCPTLLMLFTGLKDSLALIQKTLTAAVEPTGNNVNQENVFASVTAVMAQNIPEYLLLIGDLLVPCVRLFLIPKECEDLLPIFNSVLDPHGNVSKALSDAMSSPGSAMFYGKILLSSFLPYKEQGGALDYIHIFAQLFCVVLQILNPDADWNEMTGGYCPVLEQLPKYQDLILSIVCSIANLVETGLVTADFTKLCDIIARDN